MTHNLHTKKFPTAYKIAALLVALGVAMGSYYYYLQMAQAPIGIIDFSDTRDSQFILGLFDKDWYWLTASSRDQYSPEYMLQYRASSQQPQHVGNLSIKVAYDNDQPIGFVAYYKKSFYQGFILFLDVIEQYRKQGWGKKLMEYAIHDLTERGVSKISLLTRVDNERAQSLYKKLGFVATRTYYVNKQGFVDFDLKVN